MRILGLGSFAWLLLLVASGSAWGQQGVSLDPARAFITRWRCEAGQELRIPLYGAYSYEWVQVDAAGAPIAGTAVWGYGQYRRDKPLTFVMPVGGDYRLLAGPVGISYIYMYNANAATRESLRLVEQWGSVQWTGMGWAFYGCSNMDLGANAGKPDLSHVTDMRSMFEGCTSLKGSVAGWEVSTIERMRGVFEGCSSFDQPLATWRPVAVWHLIAIRRIGLAHSGLSVENYSATLKAWAAMVDELPRGVRVDANDLLYNDEGRAARLTLWEEKGWVFKGDAHFGGPTAVAITGALSPLVVGSVQELRAIVYPPRAPQGVSWSLLQNTAGASVVDGRLSATQEGNVTVWVQTIATPSQTASVKLRVEYAVPTGVIITKANSGMVSNTSQTLLARVEPAGALQAVKWDFEGAHVGATIDSETGVLSVTQPAILRVRATSKVDPSLSATVSVVVTSAVIPVTGLDLAPTEATVLEGEEVKLVATVSPSDATDQDLTWRSDAEAFATVDQQGNVRGVKAGEANISVWTSGKAFLKTCKITVKAPTIAVTGVSLPSFTASVEVGRSLQLVATVQPPSATDKRVMWSSSAEGVAGVDEFGNVRGVTVGNANIQVKTIDGNFTQICSVDVIPATVPVSGITLTPETVTVLEGESVQLTAAVVPTNATNQSVKWSSNAEDIATVDQSGTVQGIKTGDATITAESVEGGFTKQCKVTVKEPTVSVVGITLTPESATLVEGESVQLTAAVLPANATNQSVKWSSNAESIATVDGEGKVVGVKPGEAIITVESADGGFTKECKVTVKIATVPVTGITLTPESVTLVEGESVQLTAAVLPANATNPSVKWRSNAEGIATVDGEGTVVGVSPGNAIITVESAEGGYTKECRVTVDAVVPSIVPVESLSLNTSTADIPVNGTLTIVAQILPENASNQNVKWSSNDESIVSVDANGVVLGVKEGQAVVSAESADGGFVDVCTVTVLGDDMTRVESLLLRGVSVSPNPFDAQLVVHGAENVLQYELIRMSGELACIGDHDGEARIALSTSHLRSGIYLLRLHSRDGMRVERVMKR